MAVILVVDDELALRNVMRRVLGREGHEVLVAADGAEGARLWRQSAADLVILDIYMPEMDGIELLVQLRTLAPNLPVVIMSGGDQTRRLDLLMDARLLGAHSILAKPFSLDELRKVVATALESSGRGRSA
jgi:CheY-like chemotaxis protein